MFFDVLRCIVIDFFQPVSYLLVIFAAGVLAAGFFLRIRRLTGWRIRSVPGPFAGVSAGFAADGSFFPGAGQPLFPGPYPV